MNEKLKEMITFLIKPELAHDQGIRIMQIIGSRTLGCEDVRSAYNLESEKKGFATKNILDFDRSIIKIPMIQITYLEKNDQKLLYLSLKKGTPSVNQVQLQDIRSLRYSV